MPRTLGRCQAGLGFLLMRYLHTRWWNPYYNAMYPNHYLLLDTRVCGWQETEPGHVLDIRGVTAHNNDCCVGGEGSLQSTTDGKPEIIRHATKQRV